MALNVRFDQTGDGQHIATINGKMYRLLAGYEHTEAGGWFFLAVAGHTPLKADDLDEHWAVVHQGPVDVAFAQRPFSYHLALSDEAEPPPGCDWPRLKSPPAYFAFVGPTTTAVTAQVLLALEQYRPGREPDRVLHSAIHVPDHAGRGPDALLVRL